MNCRQARLSFLALASMTIGCVPPYKPPTPSQPHAIIKLRRSYDTTAGTTLREYVHIDEHYALDDSVASGVARAARNDSLLAHPRPSTFEFGSEFSHVETKLVHESYQEMHTVYESESYDCSSGYGTSKSYRTCSHSVPRTSYETRYRDVWKQVPVSDGACSRAIRFAPQDGHVYLLQFTYHDQSVCSLSCFEQRPAEAGTFSNALCPAAPAQN